MHNLEDLIAECNTRTPEELEKIIGKMPVVKKEFYIKKTISDNKNSILSMLNDKGYSLKEVASFINKFFNLKVNKVNHIYPISDKNILEILGDQISKQHKINSTTKRGRPPKVLKNDTNIIDNEVNNNIVNNV